MGRKKIEKPVEEAPRSKCVWTEEEIDRLFDYWGSFSLPVIARRLGRTVGGVKSKAAELNLGSVVENSDMILLTVLFREFGINRVSPDKVKKLKQLGFKIHTLRVDKQSFRMIDIEEFWKFAEKYPHFFDFSKLETNALGAEPDWVKSVRTDHYQRSNMLKPMNTKWNYYEISELIRLVKAKEYTCTEIAKKLRRTDSSVRHKLNELNLEEKPLRADCSHKWTDDEEKRLVEMLEKKKSYNCMSFALNKSKSAIRSKIKRMYSKEDMAEIKQSLRIF